MLIHFTPLKKSYKTLYATFTNDIDVDNVSYHLFINYWEEQYRKKRFFNIYINLESLSMPNLAMISDFLARVKVLKKQDIQYIEHTILVLDNPIVSSILYGMWNIVTPLNTVYMVTNLTIGKELLSMLSTPSLELFVDSYILCNNIVVI